MSLKLVFTPHGTAELERDGKKLWSSDADEDFAEENQNEFLEEDEDADSIIDYLVEQGLIQENEEVETFEEALDDDGVLETDEGDDDDDGNE